MTPIAAEAQQAGGLFGGNSMWVEIGDEITTIGGIMGRVVAIKDDEDAIIIETGSDRVKMKFKKWCISTVDTVKNPAETAPVEKKSLTSFFKKKKQESESEK